MSETAKLSYGDKSLELKVFEGSEGEKAIDIAPLRAKTGLVTYDPGFMNTGSCQSSVTFIDGDKGILRYRGYPIEELAEKSTFLEVSYLLLNGELPSAAALDSFKNEIVYHTMLHEDVKRFYSGFPKDAHPMAICASVVGALSTFYKDSLSITDQAQVRLSMVRLLAKFPTIAAYSYKHSIGQPFMYPQNQLDYTSNFLQMMFATPCEMYNVNPTVARALDLLLILHADHEQNCSTSTVRLVGSSNANLFASISAGVNALWGPLHGGANQAVIEMLQKIANEGISGKTFLERAKSKDDTTRLMGFGHRVYKNHDPRARILKKASDEVLSSLKINSQMLDIAKELEEMALSDEYFISRKLYPNVDFYSGIIYQAIGIPVNMFTVLFAMGRMPGWLAHWREMHQDKDTKIGRPRQIYQGAVNRPYKPASERLAPRVSRSPRSHAGEPVRLLDGPRLVSTTG
jgi:citrate synthase